MARRNERKGVQIVLSYVKIIRGEKMTAWPRKEDAYGILGYL